MFGSQLSQELRKQHLFHDRVHVVEEAEDYEQFQEQLSPQPQLNELLNENYHEQQKLPTIKIFKINPQLISEKTLKINMKKAQFQKKYNPMTKKRHPSSLGLSTTNLSKFKSSNFNRFQDNIKSKTMERTEKKLKNQAIGQIKITPYQRIQELHENQKLPSLNTIELADLLIKDEDNESKAGVADKNFHAFYYPKLCFVRGIKYQGGQIRNIEHAGVLQIFGKIKINQLTYIVMQDHQNQTLDKILDNYGASTEKFIRKTIKDLLQILIFLTKQNIPLKTIFPSQVYITNSGKCLLDIYQPESFAENTYSQSSSYFMSPQLIAHKEISQKSNIWSIGTIILNMVLGRKMNRQILFHPYNQDISLLNQSQRFRLKGVKRILQNISMDDNSGSIKRNIGKNKTSQQGIDYTEVSQQMYNVITSCLKIDPESRPTAQSLIKYDFFEQ